MTRPLTLVSHVLCPYVQRVAIVLAEKGLAFERIDIDLARKPDWFLRVSPLGKTPVLLVGDEAIFESSVICEYIEETASPRLHPQDPLERARHRAWMEFGSNILNNIGAFYNARDEEALHSKFRELANSFRRVEEALGEGPYFSGDRFSIVDAVFGPVFRYFDAFDAIDDFGVFDGTPKARQWRSELAARATVQRAACTDYPERLRAFLLTRNSALSERMRAESPETLAPRRHRHEDLVHQHFPRGEALLVQVQGQCFERCAVGLDAVGPGVGAHRGLAFLEVRG